MKRLFLLLSACGPTALLIALFVYDPPHHAASQPMRMPLVTQDTALQKPDNGLAEYRATIDSVNKNAALLKSVTREGEELSGKAAKSSKKLLQEVKKDRDPAPQIVVIEKTDVVKDTACVYLRDSVYSSLPFWKKHRILLQQCNIKQKVKAFFKRKR